MQLQVEAHTTWGNDRTRLYWQFAPVGKAFTENGSDYRREPMGFTRCRLQSFYHRRSRV